MPFDKDQLSRIMSDAQAEEFSKKLNAAMTNSNEGENEANKLSNNAQDGDYNQLKAEKANMSQNAGAYTKMPSYIGTKVVCAVPMTECTFLRDHKGQEVGDREDMNGYYVQYEDGYKSWSPKETFERAYRRITESERRLI